MSLPPEAGDQRIRPSEPVGRVDRAAYRIPIEQYISRYRVENPSVREALRENPQLCYLLGNVSDEPHQVRNLQTGRVRSVHTLEQGSGMFHLTNPEDAMEWKGIFNHIVGSVGHIEYVLELFANATPEQRAQFEARGYSFDSFERFGVENMRDIMFVSHAGRRRSDESKWYGFADNVHGPGDSYVHTDKLFREEEAPDSYLEMLGVENHEGKLIEDILDGRFKQIGTAIYNYADWTFAQSPVRLEDRFAGLRESQRAPVAILNALEPASTTFEDNMNQIFGLDVFSQMTTQPQKNWEMRIRTAYCAPSGLAVAEVFPQSQAG